MLSPLKIRYDLLQQYKQLKEVRLFLLADRGTIGLLLETYPEREVDLVHIEKCINESPFERYIIANDNPQILEGAIDVLEEAQSLGISLDEILDQCTNEHGASHLASKYLGGVETRSETRINPGIGTYIRLYIHDDKQNALSDSEKNFIKRIMQLVLCSTIPIEIVNLSECKVPSNARGPIERAADQDHDLCVDLISNALRGESLRGNLRSLYGGNNLYVDKFTNRLDVTALLAMANKLYLSIPPTRKWYDQNIGIPIDDLKKLVYSGRVTPVFEEHFDLFERAYLEELIDIAPWSILPGELRLRVVQAMHDLEPIIINIERRNNEVMEALFLAEQGFDDIHQAEFPKEFMKNYLMAAHDSARRLRQVCTMTEPIVQAVFPLLEFSDSLLRIEYTKQGIELPADNVLNLAAAYRSWIFSRALLSEAVINKGDFLESYYNLFFNQNVDSPLIKLSEKAIWILSRLGILKANHSILDQASIVLDSDMMTWIRELLISPRLNGENWKMEFIKIEQEEQGLATKMNLKTWILWWTQSLLATASIPSLGALAVPKAIDIALQALGIPADGKLTRLFTLKPEARLLFKIRSSRTKIIPIIDKPS